MPRRLCMTPEEAFQAGWEAPCEHRLDPHQCPDCRLTDSDIARLAVLLRPCVVPPVKASRAA